LAVLRLLVRARFRHQWRSWLVLCLLVALVSGLVLAGAEAGRRTATAFSRFEAAHGYDALVYTDHPVPKIASLPGRFGHADRCPRGRDTEVFVFASHQRQLFPRGAALLE
jgi:hypothetical protein